MLLRTLHGFVEDVSLVRIRAKVGNRARYGGRVVCIVRKIKWYSSTV